MSRARALRAVDYKADTLAVCVSPSVASHFPLLPRKPVFRTGLPQTPIQRRAKVLVPLMKVFFSGFRLRNRRKATGGEKRQHTTAPVGTLPYHGTISTVLSELTRPTGV